jgi:hypothetical protein
MSQPIKQFERSTTPENALLMQSVCRYCHRIVGATWKRSLLHKIEKNHICPEKPLRAARKKTSSVRPI